LPVDEFNDYLRETVDSLNRKSDSMSGQQDHRSFVEQQMRKQHGG